MARKTVYVSDLSGSEIPDGQHAELHVRSSLGDARLDITTAEAREFSVKGQRTARRGRKPKTA